MDEIREHSHITTTDRSQEKYIQQLNQEYERIITTFPKANSQEKVQTITNTLRTLSDRLTAQEDFLFEKKQSAVLKLKLARHFQTHDDIDVNTLYDSLIETPHFINTDKGSLHRLLEIHEQKTLQRIAEIRKKQAEIIGKQEFNPYEVVLSASSGKYYFAKLLNMPHIEEESIYMRHCVGTTDSYLNRMKQGQIEIFSFRQSPTINPKTKKLEGDIPLLTIEYDPKTGVINQIRKKSNEFLSPHDPFLADFIDILKHLPETTTDVGNHRKIKSIQSSELDAFAVKPYHLLTDHGEIHFRDFNLQEPSFILKAGEIKLTPDISREDIAKLLRILERLDFAPNQIARSPKEINNNTKVYAGSLIHKDAQDIIIPLFNLIQQYNIDHIYTTSLLEGKLHTYDIEIGGENEKQIRTRLKEKNIKISDWADDLLKKVEYLKNHEHADLIRLTVKDLGFANGVTTDELYKIAQDCGLELCPAEVGPKLRLSYPGTDWIYIAMKQIVVRGGDPSVFFLHTCWAQLKLYAYYARPDKWWRPVSKFVFRLRKKKL